MNPCECKPDPTGKSIWCPRHRMYKGPRWVKLCQTNKVYFEAWETGVGPGQNLVKAQDVVKKTKTPGPGDFLHSLLGKLGINPTKKCKCKSRIHLMNVWGPDGCEKNLDKIENWLREEAKAQDLPYWGFAAKLLIRRAISNARRAASKVGGGNNDSTETDQR